MVHIHCGIQLDEHRRFLNDLSAFIQGEAFRKHYFWKHEIFKQYFILIPKRHIFNSIEYTEWIDYDI